MTLIDGSTDKFERSMPRPMRCPTCGVDTAWLLDDEQDWQLDGEWWCDQRRGIRYADTWFCLRREQTRVDVMLEHERMDDGS